MPLGSFATRYTKSHFLIWHWFHISDQNDGVHFHPDIEPEGPEGKLVYS